MQSECTFHSIFSAAKTVRNAHVMLSPTNLPTFFLYRISGLSKLPESNMDVTKYFLLPLLQDFKSTFSIKIQTW